MQVLLVRAARAPFGHRVADRAVSLGDALLDHHHGLGRSHVVAVRAVVGHLRRGHHEAAAAAHYRCHTPPGLACVRPNSQPGAEYPVKLVVPRVGQVPRLPALGGGARIGQIGDVVLAAIDDAALDAHDVRDGLAFVGRALAIALGGGGFAGSYVAKGPERAVLVAIDRRRDVALRVERVAEVWVVRVRVGDLCRAGPRLHLRARDTGPPIGWFLMVIRARAPGIVAVTTLLPFRRPVMRP